MNGQLLSQQGPLEFTGMNPRWYRISMKFRRVEGTGSVSSDTSNSSQNIPCIGHGATANRKRGLEFEKPGFTVDCILI